MFDNLKNNARNRNIEINITKQDIIDLYHLQNGKCKLTNREMTHILYELDRGVGHRYNYNISVDRINSSLPYTRDNIQLVCSIINIIKWDLPQKELIESAKAIYENHKKSND